MSISDVKVSNMSVLELFSGIGGWSAAIKGLKESTLKFDVKRAVDINTSANSVYKANFGDKVVSRSIESFTVADLSGFDVLVMSPPCQPFTRSNTSATRDTLDPRSKAMIHVTHLLKTMDDASRPSFIALENVVGFESSECCATLLQVLSSRDYECAHFHLCPTQFGIPMGRPRYYLVARLRRIDGRSVTVGWSAHLEASVSTVHTSIPTKGTSRVGPPQPLYHFLDKAEDRSPWHERLYLSQETIRKDACWCLDVVAPRGTSTACFTKSYGRYFKGTGSVILESEEDGDGDAQMLRSDPATREFHDNWRHRLRLIPPQEEVEGEVEEESAAVAPARASVSKRKCTSEGVSQSEKPLARLRYFSPEELLRLFGFNAPHSEQYYADLSPDAEMERVAGSGVCAEGGAKEEEACFSFGPHVTCGLRKRYELLGNSVSVTVLREVLEFLFSY